MPKNYKFSKVPNLLIAVKPSMNPLFFSFPIIPSALCSMRYALCALLVVFCPILWAEETAAPSAGEAKPETLVLKMMIVNPSDQYKQIFSLKAYLPEEVVPEYIVDKGDLDLGYDAEKKAYYVMKEIEMEPGQSVVKAIQIQDVWLIPEKDMERLSGEAKDLYGKLKGTAYEEQGRLLMSNVEVLLTQIFEKQNDETATPEEHISIYRDNKRKIRDVELDLVSLRRFVSESAKGSGSGLPLPFKGTTWNQDAAKAAGGDIPAWVAWRIIFGILIFLGLISFGFYWTWQRQIRLMQKNRRAEKQPERVNLDDLFDQTLKGSDTLDLHATPKSTGAKKSNPDSDSSNAAA